MLAIPGGSLTNHGNVTVGISVLRSALNLFMCSCSEEKAGYGKEDTMKAARML